jgi:hypothetical protein
VLEQAMALVLLEQLLAQMSKQVLEQLLVLAVVLATTADLQRHHPPYSL